MKLGLVSDIHEDAQRLRQALLQLRAERVDRIIVLGDIFELGTDIEETCRLLTEAGAVGVWGNHDFGICTDQDAEVSSRYSPQVLQFMASLKPRLEIEGCFFSHIEPWLNPEELSHLWYFEGSPREHQNLDRIFQAVPHRLIFAGHYHTWLDATPRGILEWQGEDDLSLRTDRHFVVVGALCDGHYAILDTDNWLLRPYHLYAEG